LGIACSNSQPDTAPLAGVRLVHRLLQRDLLYRASPNEQISVAVKSKHGWYGSTIQRVDNSTLFLLDCHSSVFDTRTPTFRSVASRNVKLPHYGNSGNSHGFWSLGILTRKRPSLDLGFVQWNAFRFLASHNPFTARCMASNGDAGSVAVLISTEGRGPPQETCAAVSLSRLLGWLHRDRYHEANVPIALRSNLTLVVARRSLRVGNTTLLQLNIRVPDTRSERSSLYCRLSRERVWSKHEQSSRSRPC
jgi:hypothetical protein